MKLLQVINSPWAITPEMYQEIREIYATHLRGDKIDIHSVEEKIGRPLKKPDQGYEVINGSAIIPVEGPIAKKMNLFTQVSGGSSTQLIERDFLAALKDNAVEKIILNIDSPGGTVDGIQELAKIVYENRGTKPVIAYTDGMMASAAYWLGSAADKIFISGDTTNVGSIGVVTSHVDVSKYEEKMGIKTTEIYSGKYKRIASEYEPLSKEGKEYLHDITDYLYSVFVNDVARNRGVSKEDALKMADGKIFIGKQAVKVGLVDGVSTLDQLINNAVGITAKIKKEVKSMTVDELKGQHPDIANALIQEGYEKGLTEGKAKAEQVKTELSGELEKARSEAAEKERERIKAVKDQMIPGHETLIEGLMFDGATTGPEAAVKILAAEKEARLVNLKAYKEESKETATVKVSEGSDKGAGNEELSDEKFEEKCKAEWEKDSKLRAEFANDLNRYLSYTKAEKDKRFKVLNK